MRFPTIACLFLLCMTPAMHAEMTVTDPEIPSLILFDRSASMQKDLDGEPRIDVAKRFFLDWSKTLAGRDNVAVRFFAGGTNEEDERDNCFASESVISMGQTIHTREITALIEGLKPIGRKTNLAYALIQAKEELRGYRRGRIILISDGLENCDADPIPAARELAKMGFSIDVLAIGEAENIGGLGKIALISNGQFKIAGTPRQLTTHLGRVMPDLKLPSLPAQDAAPAMADMNSPLLTVIETTHTPEVIPAPQIEPLKLEDAEVNDIRAKPVAIELILDASGSMAGSIDHKRKIQIAREALKETLTGLTDPIFFVGLRAYGFDKNLPKTKKDSCPNTELLTAIRPNNLRNIRQYAYQLEPYGYTPIARSLLLAGADLKEIEAENRMIILITDGEETCDGDPIATARTLCEMGINLETHIIGFDLEPVTAAEMKAAATAGCGTYLDAQNAGELVDALDQMVTKAQEKIDPTWLRTIHPVVGGKTAATAVELNQGTYTLTRALEKGEQMYFRINTQVAQHALLRGLIQHKRLVRNDTAISESKYGLAQFNLTLYPPEDKKKRGRAVRLSGEPGTFKSIGFSDTQGTGVIFSIGSKYDRVHADSLFNLEIREAGDLYEGYDAPDEKASGSGITITPNKTLVGHLGEGDFVDYLKLPGAAVKGRIVTRAPEFAFRVSIFDEQGRRLFRTRAKGELAFDIPSEPGSLYLKIEDKNPTLKQLFTSYEITINAPQ